MGIYWQYWSKAEDQTLKLLWGYADIGLVQKATKRSQRAIRNRAQRIGLPLMKRRHNLWKKEEDDYLKENYGKQPTKDIAQQLNKTHNSVIGRAHRLGLQKCKKISLPSV